MLRRLQIAGLVALLALAAWLPLGAYLWKPGSGGAPYPPDKVPAYLRSSETAEEWARARYYGQLTGWRGAPEAAGAEAVAESGAGE